MEDNLKKTKNGRRPQKNKWKTNQSSKINLIGYDTIVNSPSSIFNMTTATATLIATVTLPNCLKFYFGSNEHPAGWISFKFLQDVNKLLLYARIHLNFISSIQIE